MHLFPSCDFNSEDGRKSFIMAGSGEGRGIQGAVMIGYCNEVQAPFPGFSCY